ncbi:MAG: 3-deoxy-manno-octulosonate cytidylyltransferase [Steroidobacteraceae bacterium]
MSFRVVIPARYASVRLPGKPLIDICGQPMLYWVHQIAVASGALDVIVATDDERIMQAVEAFGGRAMMTSLMHASGTDRIAEVALQCGWDAQDIVVNLQGDEPLMPPELLQQVAAALDQHPDAAVATLAVRIGGLDPFRDVNCVKVVTDLEGRALYFSRAPIPWGRDTAPAGLASQRSFNGARRHVGLYAYRVGALRRVSMLPPSPLEQIERLEQLRVLEHGMQIRVIDAAALPGPAVDTEHELALVRSLKGRELGQGA